jgi:uncharacterized protein (DUF1501 family)
MARHCQDFAHTTAAAAGRGLPGIEPGMPAPAGSGLSRRAFLAKGLGGMLAVYGASQLPIAALEEGIAEAQATAGQERVLVSIFLSGGADSLSMLAPVGDSRYATLRPTLALAGGTGATFTEDPRLMWAPQLEGLRTLHAEGKVSVLPAVGYTNSDQSHFTSRHFWEVGATDPGGRFGWLGRFLDRHGNATNPLQGLALGLTLAPALAAGEVPVGAVNAIDDFDVWTFRVGDPVASAMYEAVGRMGALPTADPAQRTARHVASQVETMRRTLLPYQDGIAAPVTYPTGRFASRLKGLAAAIDADLGIRVAALDGPGGYDTHADQERTLPTDLTDLSTGLLAFQRDLEARGLQDRVLVHVWSEFGRRAQQNGSGTDHGAAGIGFLVGSQVRGTMVGEFPGLGSDGLDGGGNLRATSDFRGVYCSLLEGWFGVDAAPIIPGASGFARPALLRP